MDFKSDFAEIYTQNLVLLVKIADHKNYVRWEGVGTHLPLDLVLDSFLPIEEKIS